MHLAWGPAEVDFARAVLLRDCELRAPAAAIYRALRDGGALGEALAAAGSPVAAGRALRALSEVGLVEVDRDAATARLVEAAGAADLRVAPVHEAMAARLQAGRARLGIPAPPTAPVAVAA